MRYYAKCGILRQIHSKISFYIYTTDGKHSANIIICLCQENGRRCIVVPKASSSKEGSIVGLAKYAWSGYVLECQKCGVIYRLVHELFY